MTADFTLVRRPPADPPNQRNASEQQFLNWLLANGFDVEGWECEEFALPGSWIMPDCKLRSGIFLEHTLADEILRPSQLPKLIRQCNLAKESGKDWISPRDYLLRKSRRIALAEELYGITIVLLPTLIRQRLKFDPEQLHGLIALRRADPSAYDDLLFQLIPACLIDELPVPA